MLKRLNENLTPPHSDLRKNPQAPELPTCQEGAWTPKETGGLWEENGEGTGSPLDTEGKVLHAVQDLQVRR